MGWFNDLGLRWKLFGGFGIVLGLTVIVGYLGLSTMANMNATLGEMYNKQAVGQAAILQANADLIASGRDEKNAILADDRADAEKCAQASRTFLASTLRNLGTFEPTISQEETKRALQTVRQDLTQV